MAKFQNPLMQKDLVVELSQNLDYVPSGAHVTEFHEKKCSFKAFLQKAYISPLRHGKLQIFADRESNTIILNEQGELRLCTGSAFDAEPIRLDRANDNDVVGAVKVPDQNLILINGDDDVYNTDHYRIQAYVPDDVIGNHPTLSFQCVGQFYDIEDREAAALVAKKVHTGVLKVLDFSPDESIILTKAEIKEIEKAKEANKAIKPPKQGFTLTGNKWHRPAAVLLHDTKRNWFMLIGQDEGTYFGVELQKPAKTIAQALDSLIPEDARNKEFYRQGEWFFVKVADKKVPEISDCVMFGDEENDSQSFELPIESSDSNRHTVIADEFRVSRNGEVYVQNPTVSHEEHADLNPPRGWYIYRKNTALRSYSQEGVD